MQFVMPCWQAFLMRLIHLLIANKHMMIYHQQTHISRRQVKNIQPMRRHSDGIHQYMIHPAVIAASRMLHHAIIIIIIIIMPLCWQKPLNLPAWLNLSLQNADLSRSTVFVHHAAHLLQSRRPDDMITDDAWQHAVLSRMEYIYARNICRSIQCSAD